jgi:hypothetical protein
MNTNEPVIEQSLNHWYRPLPDVVSHYTSRKHNAVIVCVCHFYLRPHWCLGCRHLASADFDRHMNRSDECHDPITDGRRTRSQSGYHGIH